MSPSSPTKTMAAIVVHEPLLTRAFVLAWTSHLLYALSANLYLHLPGFLRAGGATEFDVGLLFGISSTAAMLAKPMFGRRIDEVGARRLILIGGVMATASCIGYLVFAELRLGIYAMRMLQTVSLGMLYTSLYALAAEIVPESRRIEGLGVFGVSGVLPIGLGGLFGDLLLKGREDYRWLFAASIVLSGLALVLSFPLPSSRRESSAAPRKFRAAILQPNLLPLWFAGLLLATSVAIYFTFLKTFVQTTGVGSVGLFFSVYTVVAVVLRVFWGGLPERAGPKRVLYVALASMAFGFIVLARGSSSFGIATAGLLCGMGQAYTFPILIGLVVGRAKKEERGSALAIFQSLFDVGVLFGAPLFGFIIRATSYPVMFHLAAVFLVTGTVLFSRWDRHSPIERNPRCHS